MKRLTPISLALGLACGQAATITNVPMQGGMVMPVVSYSQSEGAVNITLDGAIIPQLIPLSVSNPNDSFAPSTPWFQALDPSQEGLAFSRRYGFTMASMTDPLPPGTQIWLCNLTNSPGLSFYRYSSSPATWEPIFGTAGSSNALPWNGRMFHPAVTAPCGTNTRTAIFQAYLVNTNTGNLVPGSESAQITLTWSNTPDGRPSLCMVQQVCPQLTLCWQSSATNYVLEQSDSILGPWAIVTNSPDIIDKQSTVVLDASNSGMFFRLKRTE